MKTGLTTFFLFFQLQIGFGDTSRNKTILQCLFMAPLSLPGFDFTFSIDTVRYLTSIANSRSDILPNYELNFTIVDEDVGKAAVSRAVAFNRGFHNSDSNNKAPSPIIIGPWFSTGCQGLGNMLHHVDLLAISPSCTSPVLVDRKKYPNLFLGFGTSQFTSLGILHFIRDVGKWNRIAILGLTKNTLYHLATFFMNEKAVESNFNVDYFDLGDQFVSNQTLSYLKARDVRIIFFNGDREATYQFICDAYIHGITGRRYFFLLWIESFSEQMPDYCDHEIIKAQLLQSAWFGPGAPDKIPDSLFGYNRTEFVRKLNIFSREKHQDFLFLRAGHDAVLKGIIALNNTESYLSTMNLSLADFQTQSKLIASVARQVIIDTKISGLQVGVMGYSKGGLVDTDYQIVALSDGTNSEYIMEIKQWPDSVDFEYDSYYLLDIKKSSQVNLPERDSPLQINQFDEVGVTTAAILGTFGGVLAVFHCLCFIATFMKSKDPCFSTRSKSLYYIGCLMVDVGSIVFVVPIVGLASWQSWILKICLISLGFAIVNSYLAFHVRNLFPFVKFFGQENGSLNPWVSRRWRTAAHGTNARSTNSSLPASRASGTNVTAKLTVPNLRKSVRKTLVHCLLFVVVIAIILTVWFILYPVSCLVVVKSVYREYQHDTITTTRQTVCYSTATESSPWFIALASINVIVLMFGVVESYRIHKTFKRRNLGLADINSATIGTQLTISAMFCGILVVTAIGGSSSSQSIAVSCFSLLSIVGSSVPVTLPLLTPVLFKNDVEITW